MTVEEAAQEMYAAYDAYKATDRTIDFETYFAARVRYENAREAYDAACARKLHGYADTIERGNA